MGWFSKILKKVKKTVKRTFDNKYVKLAAGGGIYNIAEKATEFGEGLKDSLDGTNTAKALKAADAQAEEDARIGRAQTVAAVQFAKADAKQVGATVSLGTENTDDTLEEQLKRLRNKG